MASITDMKISTRLSATLTAALLIMCAVAACGVWGVNALYGMATHVIEQDLQLSDDAGDIQRLVLQLRRYEKDAFINAAEPDKVASYLKKWHEAQAKLSSTLEHANRLEISPEDGKDLSAIAGHLKTYAVGFDATLGRLKAGELKTTQEANTDLGKVKAAVHGIEQVSDALSERANARAHAAGIQVSAVRARTLTLLLSLTAAGIAVAALLCWRVSRSITQPLEGAVKVAETVARGDLSSRIEVHSRDEVGQLMAALKRMNDSLVAMVGEVRHVSDSIATGSSEIAMGNADLSQRTEQQASNLQETAASMEQLTATVRQNADTARTATQLATSATGVAQEGGSVVGQVVTTMQAISASSNKISEIIGVIDGIAFQTNILALNAAVEAARAGEQGRGFAVVAAEVRSLAQRSAQAAKEIKSLIGESVSKVEDGTRLVATAGQTMGEIVSQVQRVSDLIGEISSASAEQSTGISQVGDAVNQLDQVTQQNAALVEESAAAAESLKNQAAKLTQTMAAFRLG